MPFSIKLTPGYAWTPGEELTIAKLVLAANPTIDLEGSVSAAAIGDNSITLTKLIVGILSADSAGRSRMADGYLTLSKFAAAIFTADAPGRAPFADGLITQLLLANASVGTDQIVDANVTLAKWSAGIIASATAKPAPTGSDLILIGDAAAGNATKYATLAQVKTVIAPTLFASAATALNGSSGLLINTPHSLGALPTQVRAVLKCAAVDSGYSTGDELDLAGVCNMDYVPLFHYGADASNVWLVRSNSGNLYLPNKSTGAVGPVTAESNWSVKIYAWL